MATGPSESAQETWMCDFEIHRLLVAITYQEKNTLLSLGLLVFKSFFQVLMPSQLR